MADGRWLPDPWKVAELRWQSSPGVWSKWVSEDGVVSENPPQGEPMPPPTVEAPCHQCGSRGVAWYRDRLLFWLCVILFWPAAFFVPKKPCCTRCRVERWDAVRDGMASTAKPPGARQGCLMSVGIVVAIGVVLIVLTLVVGFAA